MSIDFFEGLNKGKIQPLINQINRFEEMSNYQRKAVNISEVICAKWHKIKIFKIYFILKHLRIRKLLS